MDSFSLLVGGIVGFIAGICAMGYSCDTDTAIKLSNVMNASMLECVTKQVITKEQVHGIEDIFFKHIKANHGDKWGRRMIILLCILVIVVICSCLIYTDSVWYDKKHGMKYTLTDSSFTAEWDFSSPLTMLKLTKLFIQGELDTEKRNKYIRQYNRLKESLKDKYDMSDFPDYEIK